MAEKILIRRGMKNGTKYCACDAAGNPIRGFARLGDVRKHYKSAIRAGKIVLVRELDKSPSEKLIQETIKILDETLKKRK